MRLKGFISYCHEETALLHELIQHLSVLDSDGMISFWSDRRLDAGEEWETETIKNLVSSDVALFVLSPAALRRESFIQVGELPAAELQYRRGRLRIWITLPKQVDIGKRFPWNLEIIPEKPPATWLGASENQSDWCARLASRVRRELTAGISPKRTLSAEALEAADTVRNRLEDFREGLDPDSPLEFRRGASLAKALESALDAPWCDAYADVTAAANALQIDFRAAYINILAPAVRNFLRLAAVEGQEDLPPSTLVPSKRISSELEQVSLRLDRAEEEIHFLRQNRQYSEDADTVNDLIMDVAGFAEEKVDLAKGLSSGTLVAIDDLKRTTSDLNQISEGFGQVLKSLGGEAPARLGGNAAQFSEAVHLVEDAVDEARSQVQGESATLASRSDANRIGRDALLAGKIVDAAIAGAVTDLDLGWSSTVKTPDPSDAWLQQACGNFRDLSQISQFPNLKRLDLRDAPVTDISPLGGISSLDEVIINRTDVNDVSALKYHRDIRALECVGTSISDMSPLKECQHLQYLDAQRSSIRDLHFLTFTPKVRELFLNSTQVSSFPPGLKLPELRCLNISKTTISDISFAKWSKHLRDFLADSSGVHDLTSLFDLENLSILSFAGSGVSALTGLLHMHKLEHLNASACPLRDAFELLAVPSTTIVGRFLDFPGRARLILNQKVETVDLSGSTMPGLDWLEAPKLRHLSLDGCVLGDVTRLTTFSNLETLSLSGATVDSLLPLADLPKLRTLDISGAKFKDGPDQLSAFSASIDIQGMNKRFSEIRFRQYEQEQKEIRSGSKSVQSLTRKEYFLGKLKELMGMDPEDGAQTPV